MREAKPVDLFLLVLLGLIWGSSFFNIKIATYSYDPFTLALIRVIFASIPLFLLCKYKNIKIEAFSKNWKPYALIGLCNIAIPFTLIAIGTAKINSYLAAMLMSTTPMSGSILAHFFIKDEKLCEKSFENGKYFRNEFKNIVKHKDFVKDVRGKGLFNAIEFNNKENTDKMLYLLKENRLLAKSTHDTIIRLSPPLVITKQQLDDSLQIINNCINNI